mmetsp:Transcript_17339/g.38426  ORF Transcript_17339/g.38426 Transcript_17339/m.38426 type:complete len:775 (+) Transcript_17339:77-2401(+)
MEAKKRGGFSVVSDRAASDLEAFEWNSTMDLLACLTAAPDSTMSIYRLLSEDQSPKLLSEKITGVGSSLAWSPCGRRVAVGDRLGGITLFDGETGSVLHSRRSHSAPVTALCWVDGHYAYEEPAWSGMLPPLLTVPSAPSNMFAETPSREDLNSSKFSILASVDEVGHVVLAAGGTFPLQVKDIFEDQHQLQSRCRNPMALHLSPDLRCLAVLLGPGSPSMATPDVRSPPSQASVNSPEGGSPKKSPSSDLAVVVWDVRRLAIRRKELAQCSAMAERLCGVASYTQQAVDTLGTVWRSSASGFVNKIRALTECIEAYSGAGSRAMAVHSELLFTLCTGNPSDPVHAFLTRQSTPQQLSRLEKSLMQALDYVNLVTCSHLQVAVQHMLTILQELKVCAGWDRFTSIGLDSALISQLEEQVMRFAALTEQLLLDSSYARRFARTVFHLLLYQAQKLSEGATPDNTTGTPSSRLDPAHCTAPNPSDVEDFVARQQSLELKEVTSRIGSRAKASDAEEEVEASLAFQVAQLVSLVKGLGQGISSEMARHSAPLMCESFSAPSPWHCVASPELRAVASADAASLVPSPRGIGLPRVHMAWEDLSTNQGKGLKETLPEQLLILWCGGSPEAQLHLARIHLPVGAPGAAIQPQSQLATLKVNSLGSGHFMLSRSYDASHVAALILEEGESKQPTATVCLLDISALEFHPPGEEVPMVLNQLPQDALRQSAALPESYLWASSMRVMSHRGVCSIYSWRKRRLLTLDLEDEDDAEDDDMALES